MSCCCYHKGTYFQANHNLFKAVYPLPPVVVATTKVRIFKQITTSRSIHKTLALLLLLPQRYVFSSKSQQDISFFNLDFCCCCYHKGTYFQANHNAYRLRRGDARVVVATTKVRIFKQITTNSLMRNSHTALLLLPQRYVFSSKSQQLPVEQFNNVSCCCYHKGTYFQANHNEFS